MSYLNTGNGKAEAEAPKKTREEVHGQTAVQDAEEEVLTLKKGIVD